MKASTSKSNKQAGSRTKPGKSLRTAGKAVNTQPAQARISNDVVKVAKGMRGGKDQ